MSELKIQQCRLDGRYDILECLGRGSYSEVYVARDLSASDGMPHTVVIKALNSFLQDSPDQELERTLIENFRNEAVALDRVRHPNVINRLGHGTAIDMEGRTFHYLVLEYLSGGDLQKYCRHHPMPLEGALFYLEQVCAGLSHAHKHGVIHRDIKPQNLLLTADQRTVKIADFGVAKIEAGEGLITRVGTDVYAAPEHHPMGRTGPLDTASLSLPVAQLTPAADIYSLAKTAYMLLAGEAPRRFSQRPITELPEELARQPWSAYVLRVLERATRTNPEKRYQTVEEFWSYLKDAMLPHTRPLKNAGDFAEAQAQAGANNRLAAANPPPAPVFERAVEPSANSKRQRIVVPVKQGSQIETTAAVQSNGNRAVAVSGGERISEQQASPRRPRLSPRARNWLVALLLLAAFAGMLYATHSYVSSLRTGANGSRSADNSSSPVGHDFVTTSNVNLREGPSASYAIVGLAEINSTVRVLKVSGNWYQVNIIEHGQPKRDGGSSEQGWLNSSLLKAK
ncbi:MAG: serine/threonine protein kinase [Acidobacteria bacterium]|nr:serine/threonine protein kinase [Acidobacteriota bacterium]